MSNFYTENLADFGMREIQELRDILNAWVENGLPDNFDNSGVKPAMNSSSGYVFLTNEDYQVAMLNGNELELYHSLPYSGEEGFLADLVADHNPANLHADDIEYIIAAADFDLPSQWQEYSNQ